MYALLPRTGGNRNRRDRERLAVQMSKEILQDCKDGKIKGKISRLVLGELIGICKKTGTYDKRGLENLSEKKLESEILKRGMATYSGIPNLLKKKYGIEVIPDDQISFTDMLFDAIDIMGKTTGIVDMALEKGRRIKYATMIDIFHLIIAKSGGCDEFYTFDEGIEKTCPSDIYRPRVINLVRKLRDRQARPRRI